MKRETVIQCFFLGLFLLAMHQFLVITEPFLTPLLGAMVLALVAHPAHRMVCRLCPRWNENVQAALSTLTIVVLIVVPFALLCWLLIEESANMVPLAQEIVTHLHSFYQNHVQPWLDIIRPLAARVHMSSQLNAEHLQKSATSLTGGLFSKLSTVSQSLAANMFLTILNFAVMVFALFFMLRDGESGLARVKQWLPVQARDKDRILDGIETTVLGIVRGSVLTILFQVVCSTLGYFIAGIPAAVTLGLLTGLASVIPVVGTALIWLPTAIYLLVLTSVWKGVFLLIWGFLAISSADNLIRTYLIGRQARLPIFLLFLGLVGGLRVYGLRGLLIGPLLVAVIPILLDIFETQYLSDK